MLQLIRQNKLIYSGNALLTNVNNNIGKPLKLYEMTSRENVSTSRVSTVTLPLLAIKRSLSDVNFNFKVLPCVVISGNKILQRQK